MNKNTEQTQVQEQLAKYVAALVQGTHEITSVTIRPKPAQQQEPSAYDKTEINCFAQDLYDQKMRERKHGHYESMFHVIHQCIKKVSPPANANAGKPWVGLTDEDYQAAWDAMSDYEDYDTFGAVLEAKLREKNA